MGRGLIVAISDSVIVEQPSQLTLNSTYVVPPCSALTGSITAFAYGGTQPYSYYVNGNYSFNGQFGGLSQGNYTVTVNDANNCVATLKIVARVVENDIMAYANPVAPLCQGTSTGMLHLLQHESIMVTNLLLR